MTLFESLTWALVLYEIVGGALVVFLWRRGLVEHIERRYPDADPGMMVLMHVCMIIIAWPYILIKATDPKEWP